MQVDQRGPGAVVAHTFHQLTRVRARVGGEDVAGVPQVVKVGAGQAGTGERRCPGAAVEVAATKRLAIRAGEDQGRSGIEPVEVCAEVGGDEIREGDAAAAGGRLGRPERVAATGRIVDLAGNPDGARFGVDVVRGECGEFGPAEAGEGGQQDQRPIARINRIGQA